MSDSAATLSILLDIRSRLDALEATKKGLREVKDDAQSLGSFLRQGLGIGGGFAIATQGVNMLKGALIGALREAFQFAGAVKDASEALGISSGVYQTLRLEFQAAGADAGRLAEVISTQTRSLAEAREETSRAAQAYRELGLNAAEVERLPVAERMIAVANAVRTASDQTRAFDAASQLLGSRGLAGVLSALRRLGTEGPAELEKLYAKQGLIMNDDTLERLDQAGKAWEKLWHSVVIGSGGALVALEKISESLKKDTWGTMFAFLKGGGTLNSPAFVGTVAMNTVGTAAATTPTVPSGGGPRTNAAEEKAKAEAAKAAHEAATRTAEKMLAAREAFAASNRSFAESLKAEGEAIRKSTLTPLEQYTETLARINQALAHNVISSETATRAYANAKAVWEAAEKPASQPDMPKPAERSERPSGDAEGALSWVVAVGTQAEQVADLMRNTIGAAVYGISDGIYGWITGTMSFGQAMQQLGATVFRTMIDTIVQMGVQWVVTQALIKTGMVTTEALGDSLRMGRVAKENAAEAATLPAKTAGAAASGMSSFGATLLFGALAVALIASLMGGFADGGFTGRGGKYEPAGVVHRGEVVFSQADIARAGGVSQVEAMRLSGGQSAIEAASFAAPSPVSPTPLSAPVAGASLVAGALAAAGMTGGRRESGRDHHYYIDRDVFMAAIGGNVRAIAHEVYLENVRKGA